MTYSYSKSINLHYKNGDVINNVKYDAVYFDGINYHSAIYKHCTNNDVEDSVVLLISIFACQSKRYEQISKTNSIIFESIFNYTCTERVFPGKNNNAYSIFIRLSLHDSIGRIQYKDVPFHSIDEIANELDNSFNELLGKMKNNIHARDIQLSTIPCAILAPKAASFFIHEMVGHLLEYDYVNRDNAIYGKKAYQKLVFPEFINICDDPFNINGLYLGEYDDDGEPLLKRNLILNGYLNDYITTRRCATLYDKTLYRMSNLYLKNNPEGQNLNEIIANFDNDCIVVFSCVNGIMNPNSGDYMLLSNDFGYISGEELVYSDKLITLSGSAIMNNIQSIGNDMNCFFGICNKQNQNIMVGSGSPSIVLSPVQIS